MSEFDTIVGKTIEKIIYNSDCLEHESVNVFFTDGTPYRIQSSGGETWKGEGWSEINLTNVT